MWSTASSREVVLSLSLVALTTGRRSWEPRPRAGVLDWAALRLLTAETVLVTLAQQIREEDMGDSAEDQRLTSAKRRWRMCWPISRPDDLH